MTNAKDFLSKRVLSVAPSLTLAITAKAKEMKAQGIDIVSLSAGEPDFDTPAYAKQAAIAALEKGVTKYTPATGTPELRKAIAKKLERDQKISIPPEQIIVSNGAKHSIFNALFALIDPGDEILIPAPYWLSYPDMVSLLGGENVILETDEKNDFKLTPKVLSEGITSKTKALILNSPSNPTGAVYSRDEFLKLIDVLKKHPHVVIISDEIYEKIIFDGREHYSIASLDPDIAQRTIVVNGMSKTYSMTGWRLGYAAYPNKEWAKAVSSLQSHSTSNPTSFAQPGGIVALEKGEEDARKACQLFQKRRDFFYEKIAAIPKLKPFKSQGSFYLFVNVGGLGLGSIQLAEKWIEEAHVAVVPGQPFGSDNYVRMSFASTEKNLEEAARRIKDWVEKQ
ncbi:MAG: pyridoxal phosphate-dependent aminotransferase [Candidatus Omnitrophica bacterium]|nr:pyridoxal phosphate-dependent aminotransferase [Candidatus Omnitrophota bacterium]